jgi:Domain of unknown function (DUF3850)
MNVIHLKTWPQFYEEIITGRKSFEVRKNDRGFACGDILVLQEWEPPTKFSQGGYTGRQTSRRVDYLLPGGQFGVEPGYVVMAISPVDEIKDDVEVRRVRGEE